MTNAGRLILKQTASKAETPRDPEARGAEGGNVDAMVNNRKWREKAKIRGITSNDITSLLTKQRTLKFKKLEDPALRKEAPPGVLAATESRQEGSVGTAEFQRRVS